MLERLRRNESGVALGLAIIMIVLLGVMGAGLLTFVRSDLEAVVEANQGQRALSLADAGLQAARRQLSSDAEPDHYDGNAAGNLEWAHVASPGDTAGKTLTLEEGAVRVEIRYLLPSTTAAEVEDENHAPEQVPGGLADYPGDKNYFVVTSEGRAGGALRKVQAILYTSRLDARYTPDDTTLEGDMTSRGSVSPNAPLTTRPDFYDARLWSWRELYE